MDVHLKDGHVLCAYCTRPSGEATYSELDLNSALGTHKGKSTLNHLQNLVHVRPDKNGRLWGVYYIINFRRLQNQGSKNGKANEAL